MKCNINKMVNMKKKQTKKQQQQQQQAKRNRSDAVLFAEQFTYTKKQRSKQIVGLTSYLFCISIDRTCSNSKFSIVQAICQA